MSHILSVVFEHLGFFDPEIGGLPIHGANLITAAMMRRFAADPQVEALEVFLPPHVMTDVPGLAAAARSLLPPERAGRGFLRFYPVFSLPEVWQDPAPRILYCIDPDRFARDRYLRDRYATGPTPIACDTHAFGHHALWRSMAPLAHVPAVPYDSFCCISRACGDALAKAFDGYLGQEGARPPARLVHLPHGVDSRLYHSSDAARRSDARRLLRLPEEAVIALYLGRITPNDKADLLPLLSSFARASSDPRHVLTIAGSLESPGYIERLEQEAARLGIADRVVLRAGIGRGLTPLYFAAADLFVFPADAVQESLGNTVLEAMASGLPTIVSDWDGMTDLVVDRETGFLVPTWWMPGVGRAEALSPVSTLHTNYLLLAQSVWVDTDALTAALRRLLVDSDLRDRMGRAGRERIDAEYTWELIVERWNELWRSSIELAARETEADRRERQAGADRLGIPAPHLRLFAHYATGVIGAETHTVRLSEAGTAAADKTEPLTFYDETLPLIQPNILDALVATLAGSGGEWRSVGEVAQSAARRADASEEDVRFHLGLLLKRGAVDLATAPQQP